MPCLLIVIKILTRVLRQGEVRLKQTQWHEAWDVGSWWAGGKPRCRYILQSHKPVADSKYAKRISSQAVGHTITQSARDLPCPWPGPTNLPTNQPIKHCQSGHQYCQQGTSTVPGP